MAKAQFIWSPEFADYDLGPAHPLRPERLLLTHDLIADCGLFANPDAQVVVSPVATEPELLLIHSREYLDAMRSLDEGKRAINGLTYGLGTRDNPLFDNMYEISARYCGGSLCAAQAILRNEAEVAFNISGGLHHAHRSRAAGFCIFNDAAIVAAWLLQQTQGDARIVYLDIDAHHGDGVQEAFYDDPRVLTISLHESGRTLFPGTGFPEEIGVGAGEGYAVNLPLAPFTTDGVYLWAYEQVVPPLIEAFRPDFVISQLGADTHFFDPLTHMCLTTLAFEKMFASIRTLSYGRWIALGGGGYSLDAVPRIWTLAWAQMLEEKPDSDIIVGRQLRDKQKPILAEGDLKHTQKFAENSVDAIRRLVFPHHGL
jgi:acetoin utilization protein AcuC